MKNLSLLEMLKKYKFARWYIIGNPEAKEPIKSLDGLVMISSGSIIISDIYAEQLSKLGYDGSLYIHELSLHGTGEMISTGEPDFLILDLDTWTKRYEFKKAFDDYKKKKGKNILLVSDKDLWKEEFFKRENIEKLLRTGEQIYCNVFDASKLENPWERYLKNSIKVEK